jgi:8-oxo-dGTP pyrophosphatase MutT (NUDIX family)
VIDPAAVVPLVSAFADPSDGESLKSRELVLMLLASTPFPFSRRQFTPGHITGTGLVLAPEGARVLLVHHRRLDRWLLPGGHVESEDATVAEAARREVVEETGALLAPDAGAPLIGIDVHGIPARRSEPYHLHHDLMFFFRAVADGFQVSEESRDVTWCSPADFDRYAIPTNIRRAFHRVFQAP